MTTQQTASTPESQRSRLETQYGSIGISAVVAAVEGRRKPVAAQQASLQESLEALKFAQRFAVTDSD